MSDSAPPATSDLQTPTDSAQTATSPTTKSLFWRILLPWALRLFVAGLFIYAALIKIDDPTKFAKDIRNYEMFPPTTTNIMAYTIPWLELTTALLLVVGFWRLEARILIGSMLAAFTALKLIALLQGLALDCGCFGDSLLAEMSKGWNGVWLNIGMLIALLGDAFLTRPANKPTAANEPAR